ncbi:hypothetical protein JS532_05365 [Bifidobacterium callimiconis]|uniref:hypothetical protein n=1 Tax=Bifidobacterium callimiconis TaxID=2306973 RepID=UPI001BDBC075|nr:hypothetical protein [Bifidobacterium callimiconis]MBT1177000.1 hypothetical protein [Bifidobacterium callimiconis]
MTQWFTPEGQQNVSVARDIAQLRTRNRQLTMLLNAAVKQYEKQRKINENLRAMMMDAQQGKENTE